MTTKTRLLVLAVPTLLCMWLSAHLHISGDLSALFPGHGAAAALGQFTRAFGGGDVGLVLVRGKDPAEVAAAAHDIQTRMAKAPSVTGVLAGAPKPSLDPTLAWMVAGPTARAKLAHALTPEGMKQRLAGSRELLMGPASGDAETILARDPLRLALIPWEGKTELAAGLTVNESGDFSGDGGRAQLVVLQPRGRAFDPKAARAFVSDFDAAKAAVVATHPGATLELTGGHAVAVAMRRLLIRDLALSGTLSLILASVAFLVTFRRMRALVAVLPPLALGTLWTTGLAAFFPHGLSAMSIAFAAVVVGVGVDTGVHVYAALLDGRRAGMPPEEAAVYARARTWKPTLLAAIAAGLTFGALALSDLRALKELGILCGAGEFLTSVAILLITPDIGALLERGAPPPHAGSGTGRAPAWIRGLISATGTRGRAVGLASLLALPLVVLAVLGGPQSGHAIVALRPEGLQPLQTQRAIFDIFGGKPGQWLVLSIDHDREAARDRADAVAEALDPLAADHTIEGFDALASFAPGKRLLAERMAARDREDLPALRERLQTALRESGWDPEACAAALDAFAKPTPAPSTDPPAWLRARHLGQDGVDTIAVTYVRPSGDPAKDARALAAIRAADPHAIVTGYTFLEVALKDTLRHDLPRIAGVALLLVVIALGASLRRPRDVVLSILTMGASIAIVTASMRVLHIPWHAYDALVVPVLLGITMDEGMFLLYAAREGEAKDAIATALTHQGPLVVATALTTSAGFAALLVCRFEGLFDVGAVGAIGSVAGLVAALLIVPAGLRLTTRE